MSLRTIVICTLLSLSTSLAVAVDRSDATGIAWFKGDVNAAFIEAQKQHKPVLLYWGAVWCPPCQQLKSTVFNRPDFIARTTLFIPVYLDGDDEGAQKWGEAFGVSGYPTLLILDANKHELQRIAGGMDLTQYANVLDLALADAQPVSAILDAAITHHALSASQCKRLALNGWVLDDVDGQVLKQRTAQLDGAAQQCPKDSISDRTRLQIIAAYYATRADKATLNAHIDTVARVLEQPSVALQVADALWYLGDDFFKAVKARGAARSQRFITNFTAIMEAASHDERFAEADQLISIASELQANKTLSATGTIAPKMAKAARARLEAALSKQATPYVRSGLINAGVAIYDLLGQNGEAYRMVKAELANSSTPYYYKADLADLAESLGRNDEAIDWLSQAYAESKGTATRAQWGVRYVSGLLRLKPNDTDRIRDVSMQVISELDGNDRIYRRARTSLAKLDVALRMWNDKSNGSHRETLNTLRSGLQKTCVRIPANEPARQSCDAFLARK
jgi:protein disulfide-isomerase